MVSLTLAIALAVRLIGAFFVSAGFTSGVVVVAIGISLKGLSYDYSKAQCCRIPENSPPGRPQTGSSPLSTNLLDDPAAPHGAGLKTPTGPCQQVYNPGLGPLSESWVVGATTKQSICNSLREPARH